jgi:hypothetical protein
MTQVALKARRPTPRGVANDREALAAGVEAID